MLPLFQICWTFAAFSIVSLTQNISSTNSNHPKVAKNYSLIWKIIKLTIISRVMISVVVWLHFSQYNNLMHQANDYVKALNPQNYVFISADTDNRPIIDFNLKSESNSKLLMFNINPLFTLRDSQSMLKLSFISKQNKVYSYFPSLIRQPVPFQTYIIKQTLGSIVSKKIEKYLTSKGYQVETAIFSSIAEGQPRLGTKYTGLKYWVIYNKH